MTKKKRVKRTNSTWEPALDNGTSELIILASKGRSVPKVARFPQGKYLLEENLKTSPKKKKWFLELCCK